MASLFKRGGKGKRGAVWHVAYFDHTGTRKYHCTRTTDKAAAERIAKKLEADAALRRDGVIDPSSDRYAAEARRPMTEHLADFKASLIAKNNTVGHCEESFAKVKRIIELCQAEFISDLTSSSVQEALCTLRHEGKGRGLKTCNHYLRAVKSFTRWLARDRRTRDDALVALKSFNAATDRKLVRREMSVEELGWLISTTEQRTCPDHAVCGSDRAMLYRLACGTGFRASELRSLTPKSFDLNSTPPTVTVEAAHSKHRREDVQPIRQDLAELLRPWLGQCKNPEQPFVNVPINMARMLRADLQAARQAWLDESANVQERKVRENSDFLLEIDREGNVIDFHAIRHTYISALVNGGASVKVAQELARHSTPTLTIGLYAHVRRDELRTTLESIPSVTDKELRLKSAQHLGREMVPDAAIRCEREEDGDLAETRRNSLPDKRKREALQLSATPRVEYPLRESNPCCRTENPES